MTVYTLYCYAAVQSNGPSNIISNNYEWVFSGIGVLVITVIIGVVRSRKSERPLTNRQSNANNNTISITNSIMTNEKAAKSQSELSDERLKDKTRILFIDDMHTDYKMVSILKKAGWSNTKSVKDILDLDDQRVLESDIIFVDINGVGVTMFEDQGLGLASALKSKYSKKKIILYSAETAGDRFHKALREVDDCLAKNAEPYQFINLVESLSKELHQ
jgi:hypothetical protein